MNKYQKQIQVISCFLNLHTLAKNAKKYTPIDKKTGQMVSEEMRRLDFYSREIDRHSGRDIMRELLRKVNVEKT